MNVAVDIRCLMKRELTGVGEYTFHLLKHLFKIDSTNQYYLFCNSAQNNTKQGQNFAKLFDNDNTHLCKFKYPNKILNTCLRFFKYPRLDLLINQRFNTKIDLFFFPNLNFLQTKCPYVITAHDLSFEFFPEYLSMKRRLWHWFLRPRKLFQGAKKIIAVSKNTGQDLISRYDISRQKISIIYSGISPNYRVLTENDIKLKTIKNKYKLPSKFILFLGTIEPRKNIQSLVSAFNIFNKSHHGYSLVIAGKKGWKTASLAKMLKQTENNSGLALYPTPPWRGSGSGQDKIIWTQFVPDSDKRYLYNLASMFIYPSYYEGFGFPPLEAMASGCPVITSNNSSMSEICSDSAILIDPTNVNDLARAMGQMVDPQLAGYYKNKGLEKAKEFSWYRSAQEALNVFKSMNFN